MADRAHSTGRRALLAGLGATTLMYLPVHANGVHPDADLLAMEPEFRRRHALHMECRAVFNRAEKDIFDSFPDVEGESIDNRLIRVDAVKAATGFLPVEAAMYGSYDALFEMYETIHATRARTLEGLCFKARVYRDAEVEVENTLIDDILAIDAAMTA